MAKSPIVVTFQNDQITTDQAFHEAPIIHIDGAGGLIGQNGEIKFNLFQDRLLFGDPSPDRPPVVRVVCARLVMSQAVFAQLSDWLAAQKVEIEKTPPTQPSPTN